MEKELRMIRKNIKRIFFLLVSYTGMLQLLRFYHRDKIVIFSVHGVVDENKRHSWTPLRHQCSRQRFETVLASLLRIFTFITLEEAVDMLAGKQAIRPYCAVLTFDDGYKSNVDVVLPLLKKYRVPAAFFVPTEHINTQQPLWFDVFDYGIQIFGGKFFLPKAADFDIFARVNFEDKKQLDSACHSFFYKYNHSNDNDLEFQNDISELFHYWQEQYGVNVADVLIGDNRTAIMTWQDVQRADQAGITIGSHSARHLKLGTIEEDIAKKQLILSKQTIEERLGKECCFFCYPNGNENRTVRVLAKECGYKAALTTRRGLNSVGIDPFAMRRMGYPLRGEFAHIILHVYGIDVASFFSDRQILGKRDTASAANNCKQPARPQNDGRNRMAKNVWVGWIAQLIYLIAGFILPHMIDRSMGRDALGAWDFSWTLIAYFGLVQAGLVSSVNRYIARYRAREDVENINISANSVAVVFLGMALLVLGFTFCAYHFLPELMGNKLGEYLHATQWVIVWLGLSLASQISFAVFGGILAGSFRWDIHYYINVASRVATLIGMVFVLVLHGGLVALGFIYFVCEAAVLSLRVVFAFRFCPELRLRIKYVRLQRAKEMLHFGLKTYLPSVGDMLIDQTMNLFVVWFFGPALLALYARPRALVRNVQTFVTRYAFVLVPTASSIHAKKNDQAMAELLIEGAKNGAYILLPMVIFLGVCGDSLLAFWMGEQYVQPHLFLMMIVAFLPPIFHLPLVSVISGANMHGRLGMMRLVSSLVGLVIVYTVFKLTDSGLVGAVTSFAVPLWLGVGLYTPYYAHIYLQMSLRQYIGECIVKPLIILSPYLTVLVVIRFTLQRESLLLIYGVITGAVMLPALYWNFVLTNSFKNKIREKLAMLKRR